MIPSQACLICILYNTIQREENCWRLLDKAIIGSKANQLYWQFFCAVNLWNNCLQGIILHSEISCLCGGSKTHYTRGNSPYLLKYFYFFIFMPKYVEFALTSKCNDVYQICCILYNLLNPSPIHDIKIPQYWNTTMTTNKTILLSEDNDRRICYYYL